MANKLRVLNFSGLDIEQNTWFFKNLFLIFLQFNFACIFLRRLQCKK